MLALVLTVPANEAELASDALWALGVAAVEERSAAGAEIETEDRLVELWTSLGTDVDAITAAAEGFPARWRWRTVEVDPAVTESWRAHAVPSWIDRTLVVVPSWLHVEVPPGTLRVDIDPGAAFGLGDHPTTVLTLRLLRDVFWPGATVLDVGCGSGVLSVVAARLGAPYVEAIDISPAAVEATTENAERNQLAPVLVDLAHDFRRVVAPSGALIVSGVLDAAHDHVVAALAPMKVVRKITKEGWAALLARH
jgi:ribosomal protein L11 methyltransferase